MLLTHLTVRNFCCYANLVDVPLHRLTVFIGENDAGKSALLTAIKLLLTDERLVESHYYHAENGQVADTITISGTFDLGKYDTLPSDYRSIDGKALILTKTFSDKQGIRKCEVKGLAYCDERYGQPQKQSASVQKELLNAIGIAPGANEPIRIQQFQQAADSGNIPKRESYFSVSFSDLKEYLPLFESIASADYKNPDTLVQRTLQNVVNACLNPINQQTASPELLPELVAVKAKIYEALNIKASEMKESLARQIPKLKDVRVSEPVIDFSKSVSSVNLMLDLGQGMQMASAFGSGTNKKLWMGLLDWERHIQQEYENRAVIRVYDEPDVNLDYSAERKLFGNILDATNKSGSRTQAIVATHSVTLVDRSPAQSINLIRVKDDGTRVIDCLCGDTDDGIKHFLTSVGRSVGITNSALFYERVFLVVEGESEENALPIFYRHLYGHSFIEDGIVLINMQTCGAWKSVLSILQRHKSERTVLLLDRDCTNPNSGVNIYPDTLRELGYAEEWCITHCFYIGTKEFEDAFATSDIVAVLNQNWPKSDGAPWMDHDIDVIRNSGTKFSQDLLDYVKVTCIKQKRSSVRKPEFAEALARHCCSGTHIPAVIKDAFCKVKLLSDC
jgi:energy-coupling factor transporter ATP-binding protein EcfA2